MTIEIYSSNSQLFNESWTSLMSIWDALTSANCSNLNDNLWIDIARKIDMDLLFETLYDNSNFAHLIEAVSSLEEVSADNLPKTLEIVKDFCVLFRNLEQQEKYMELIYEAQDIAKSNPAFNKSWYSFREIHGAMFSSQDRQCWNDIHLIELASRVDIPLLHETLKGLACYSILSEGMTDFKGLLDNGESLPNIPITVEHIRVYCKKYAELQ